MQMFRNPTKWRCSASHVPLRDGERSGVGLCARLCVVLTFALQGMWAAFSAHLGHALVEDSFTCGPSISASEANALLERVQRAYNKVKSLHAKFTQESRIAALDESEEASGTVRFLKPGRMRWDYEFPEPQMFLVRDETMYLFQPELSQVVVQSLREVLLADMPVSFLMGIGKLDQDFSVVSACSAGSLTRLSLVPKQQAEREERREDLRSFDLLVDPDTFLPAGARVVDVAGNVTSIALHDVRSGAESSAGTRPEDAHQEVAKESDFEPSFPSGVDVDDRRDLGPEGARGEE